jgi:hypothetical protein
MQMQVGKLRFRSSQWNVTRIDLSVRATPGGGRLEVVALPGQYVAKFEGRVGDTQPDFVCSRSLKYVAIIEFHNKKFSQELVIPYSFNFFVYTQKL